MSLVQHCALAGRPNCAGVNGSRQVFARGRLQNVGRTGQIALGVAAHQFKIHSKSNIALNNSRAHFCRSDVAFAAMFGITQWRAAMGYGKFRCAKIAAGAALQALFEGNWRADRHSVLMLDL